MQYHLRLKAIKLVKENLLLIVRSNNWFDFNSRNSMSLFLILSMNFDSGLPLNLRLVSLYSKTLTDVWTIIKDYE